jgi:hypothetical protein
MALVTLSTFKLWVNDANTSDGDLQLCLSVAEKAVIDHLGWDPATGSRTEYLSGRGLTFINVRARNITAITSVTIDGIAINVSLLRVDGDCIYYIDGITTFPNGRMNITAVYVAGWATIPELISHTVMRIGNIVRMDKKANGQAEITTPDGGTRKYNQYIKYDQQLAVLSSYRVEPYVA